MLNKDLLIIGILFLSLIGIVSAVPTYNNISTGQLADGGGLGIKLGVNATALQNISNISVFISCPNLPDYVSIYSADGLYDLATNNTPQINTTLNYSMTAGTSYLIVVTYTTHNYCNHNYGGNIFPKTESNFTFISSIYNLNLYNLNYGMGIDGIWAYPITSLPISVNLTSPPNNTIQISNQFKLNATLNSTLYNLVNATYYIWSINGTLINTTTLNLSNLNQLTSLDWTAPYQSSYMWNVNTCVGDTSSGNCSMASTNNTITYNDYVINAITYDAVTIAGAINSFTINLSYDNSFSGITVILNYNNTNYTMQSSDGQYYNYSLVAPSVNTTANKTFSYIILLSNSTGTFYFNTSNYNQTISQFLIDDCSSYTKTLLNFSMFDEDSLSALNGTIWANINIYEYNNLNNLINQYNKTFNYLTTGSSAICLANISQNYTMSYELQYQANSSYFKQYKTIQMITINNNTIPQNISLYDLLSSSGYPFKVILVGNLISSTGDANLLVDVQRQYINLNKFISVESSVSSSDGTAVVHLVTNNQVYNFVVSYNGIVLGTFNNYNVQCQNPSIPQCSITLNLAQSSGSQTDFTNYGNITQIFLLSNTTLYQTFSTTDGSAHSVNSVVVDNSGNTTICNNTIYGTSGTLTCLIPIGYQNQSYYVLTSVDGNYIGSKFFSQGSSNTNWYGADVLIELLMLSALVLLFIAHPITMILGSMIAILAPVLLIALTGATIGNIIGAVIFYIIAAFVAIWAIGRRNV